MNKIYHLLIICLLTFSCTENSSIETENEETAILEIDGFAPNSVNIGDLVTIVGTNFDVNETYVVKFNGVDGIIQETTTTSIMVQVPEGATTGAIILSYGSTSKIVGTIEIIVETEAVNTVIYALKEIDGETPKLVTLDPTNGTQNELVDFQTTNYFGDFTYSSSSNQLFGVSGVVDSGIDSEIYTVNLTDNTFDRLFFNEVPNSDYELAVSSSGIVYALQQENLESPKIVSLDPTNGNQTELIDFQTTNYLAELVYSPSNNKLLAISGVIDSGIISEIYSIDLSDNTFSVTAFNGASNTSYEVVVSSSGTIYGLKQQNGQSPKLVTIEISSGEETELIDFQTTNYMGSLVYNSSSNQLFLVSGVIDSGIDSEIYTVNLADNTFDRLFFNEVPNSNYTLIAR